MANEIAGIMRRGALALQMVTWSNDPDVTAQMVVTFRRASDSFHNCFVGRRRFQR